MAGPILDDENPVAGAGMADSSTATPCVTGGSVVTGTVVAGATVVTGTVVAGATVVAGTVVVTDLVGAGLHQAFWPPPDSRSTCTPKLQVIDNGSDPARAGTYPATADCTVIASARSTPAAPTEIARGERRRRSSVASLSRPPDEPRSGMSVRYFTVLLPFTKGVGSDVGSPRRILRTHQLVVGTLTRPATMKAAVRAAEVVQELRTIR